MDSLLFHPKVVHIPIAVAVLMPLVAGGILLAWWRGWLPRRTWVIAVLLQAVLVGSGFMAMKTGEEHEHRVEKIVAERHIEAHEEAAEVFSWSALGLLLLMVLAAIAPGDKGKLIAAAAAVVGTAVILFLGYRTGEAGGRLVYRHGAAAAFATPAASGAHGTTAPAREAHGKHDDDDDDD